MRTSEAFVGSEMLLVHVKLFFCAEVHTRCCLYGQPAKLLLCSPWLCLTHL